MLLPMKTTPSRPTRERPVSRVEKRRLAATDLRPRVTLSFYRYVRIGDPEAFRLQLLAALRSFGCLGRIYVASEGINAQMNVPKTQWDAFDAWVQQQSELAGVPYKIAVEEGVAAAFYTLTVKVKAKIVADGLDDDSFEVTNTGDYLTAAELNDYLDDPEAVVVDMRNNYESEVGHFDGAIIPAAVTFRDELQKIPELLKIHQNKKIALYCTGGIRCEKASAWLKHNGYENVKHLRGGIIDYARQVEDERLTNRFLGKNFVFDERLGERVSGEVIATCHLCRRTKCDTHHNCKSTVCFGLFIGCEACLNKRQGYCSWSCRLVDKLPPAHKKIVARFYNQQIRKRKPFVKTRLAR